MRIAVLGMGRMGHEVAGRLLEGGHEVTVWNRSPGKADDLAEKGAVDLSGKSPGEAVAGAAVVVTSLSDDAAVRAVVIDGGVAEAMGPGTGGGATDKVLVDMSTVAPKTATDLAEAVGHERFLASPILGAPSAVASGEALYLVAGASGCRERLLPMYETLSDRRLDLGDDPAAALVVKLLANALLLSGLAVLGEVIATGQAAGLGDDFLSHFLGSSPLVAPALRNRLDNMIAGHHDSWFTTALGAKDVRLAENVALDHRLRTPLLEAVKRRYEQAATEGFADDDLTAVIELVRRGPGESG